MLAAISKKISNALALKNVIPSEDESAYTYSFEILLSTILNFIIMLIAAVCFGKIIEALLFAVGFIPFRMLNGGYHAKTNWGCMLMLLVFECVMFVTIILNLYMYCLPFILILSLCLFFLNTLDDSANILSNKRKGILKKKSRILLSVYLIIIIGALFITESTVLQYCVIFGLGSSAFSIVLSKISLRFRDFFQ